MDARQLARNNLAEWSQATQDAYDKLDAFEQSDIDDAVGLVCKKIPKAGPVTARVILAALGVWLNEVGE